MEPRDHSKVNDIGQILARGIVAMQIARGHQEISTPREHLNQEVSSDELEAFLATRGSPVSCATVASMLNVSISTARNRLNDLVANGKLRRDGKGPATRYIWIQLRT